MQSALLKSPGCCPESLVTRTPLGTQRREPGASPERYPLLITGPASKCPVHPSSWSWSCASPPKHRESGPKSAPITHVAASSPPCWVPPASSGIQWGARLGAPAGDWEPALLSCLPGALPPNPRVSFVCSEVPGLCLGSCCPSALPVSAAISVSFPYLPEYHLPSATLPVSAFLPHSCSSLPTIFLNLCLWPLPGGSATVERRAGLEPRSLGA